MTNVQTMRQQSYSCVVLALSLGAALSAIVTSAHAEGPFSHSRTPVSGGATEMNDVNGRSFGMRFRGGHAAGDTVGRQDALTHVSLSPYFSIGPSLGFVDVRLGRANKGGLTWSFGTGIRKYFDAADVVAGGNFYHASDNITGTLLRSWGIGAEVLKDEWEIRANYVEPHGTTSSLVSQTIDQTSAAFAGNNIVFNRLDQVAEALKLMELEAGVRLPTGPLDHMELRGFVGAYAINGQTVRKATGWKTRLQAEIGQCLELGLGLNQDPLTDTTVAVTAAVTFGGYEAEGYTKSSAIHRLADPVRRPLTVPSLRTTVVVPGVVAINPSDGMAWIVRHVDENDAVGPFVGTVEDPLQSISTALGLAGTDIAFTHAGGVYDAAPDNMNTLGMNQYLYGEGLIPSVNGDRFVVNTIPLQGITDELILPDSPTFAADMTLLRPMLQGSAGDSVTLGENSRFGGFVVDGAGAAGITSNNVGGTIVRDVMVQNSVGDGILLANTMGTTTIIDSVITGATGAAFHVNGGNGSIGIISNSSGLIPAFSHIENSSQEAVLIENTTAGGIVNLTGATINDDGGTGIVIQNSAGSATIDNAQILNSTATGIRISNSSGIYNFRNSLQTSTFVDNAALQGVLIDNLGATGQATFSTLLINNRNNAGIDINSNSGSVTFIDSVSLGTPAGGVNAAVSVDSSQAGSSVQFSGALSIDGSGGRGIELTNNLAGSSFTTNGGIGLTLTTLEAIFLNAEGGTVVLNGPVSISNRLDRGISIQNSTGGIGFVGPVGILNELDAQVPGVDIQNSESSVLFSGLTIDNAMGNLPGGAGVHLVGNLAGATNTALHTYSQVDIDSVNGIGFFADNNTSIRILDGTISTQGAAAIHLQEGAWNVDLDSVTSLASIDNGIRLINTAPPVNSNLNSFSVNDELLVAAAGDGGTIQASAGPAAFLQNGGQVRFRGMLFDGNASDIFVRNSGLADDDDQFLEVAFSAFTNTAGRVIDSENLTTFRMDDSLTDDGGAGIGPNTIQLTYNEVTNDPDTTTFDQFDNPFEIYMNRNVFTDTFDNTVVILGDVGSMDAHLDVDIANNFFTLNLGLGGQDETAVSVDWDGPSRIRLASNDITLNGDDLAGNKMAYDIVHRSDTDEMLLSVINNQFTATDDDSIGLNLQTFGQSDVLIDSNAFVFGGVSATGMRFNLAADTELFLQNNELRFDADGGTGLLFSRVNPQSTFTINNNLIGLLDDGALLERGMVFQSVIGTPTLRGTQDNLIFLTNPNDPGAFIENVFTFGGTANGQILVNGALVP
ncbi:MAG: inverse autotransporter beta domain-containing protein [Planctomycetaceae bacterium]